MLDITTGAAPVDPEQVKSNLDELATDMMYAASIGLCLPSVNLAEVAPERAAKISLQLGRLIRTLARKGIQPALDLETEVA